MAKGLGALLVIGGGLWMGLGWSRDRARRAAALEAWCAALAILEEELAFRLPAIPELLESLAGRAEFPVRETLMAILERLDELGEKPFRDIWGEEILRRSGELDRGDREILCRLGETLGRCGWEDQRQAAGTVRQSLCARSGQVREELRREGRAYGALGLALGAFLTILLL